MSITLTRDELTELTGKERPTAIRRALDSMVPELYRVWVERAYIEALEPPLNDKYVAAGMEEIRDAVMELWGVEA